MPLDDFARALDDFKAATARLAAAWTTDVPGDVLGDSYPASLPSFDELAALVAGLAIEPLVGMRYRLRRDVDRFPHFIAPAGSTGTLDELNDGEIWLRLDEPLAGAEEWANRLEWYGPHLVDFDADAEPIDAHGVEPVGDHGGDHCGYCHEYGHRADACPLMPVEPMDGERPND